LSNQLEQLFYDVLIECPYGLPYPAVYRQAQFGPLPEHVMEFFLKSGYRRNGNFLYTMACHGCNACVPIRIEPCHFVPNRGQKRVWRKNSDLEVKIAPLQITNEKLAICDKFLNERFPGKGNSALDYYAGFFVNCLGSTYEIEFWLEDRLVGVSIVDMYLNSINCVYFYFDPDESSRSLGTYNILYLINYAQRQEIDYVYLGYLIEEIKAMRYKQNFNPHQLLINDKWTTFNRKK